MSADNVLPEPMVEAHVDLRKYDFMPVYGETLRRSSLNTRANDGEFRAAFWLWWSAWWQVPAASLPNDDAELCRLADLGRDTRAWKRVKAEAMRGFVLCADNRWYHPFLASKAVDAYAKKCTYKVKGALGGQKSKEIRQRKGSPATTSTTATAIESGSPATTPASTPRGTSASTNRSKGNNPPYPPTERSTSKPQVHSSIAKADEQIAEQRAWKGSLPEGITSPMQILKAATAKSPTFEELDP
jgi:hypothetical protein